MIHPCEKNIDSFMGLVLLAQSIITFKKYMILILPKSRIEAKKNIAYKKEKNTIIIMAELNKKTQRERNRKIISLIK